MEILMITVIDYTYMYALCIKLVALIFQYSHQNNNEFYNFSNSVTYDLLYLLLHI